MLHYCLDASNYTKVKRYQPELTWLQEERAKTTEARFGLAIEDLVDRLSDPDLDLCFMELERAFPGRLQSSNCDGIHYCSKDAKKVTRRLVDIAMDQLPARMPLHELKTRTLKARKQRQNHHVRGNMRKHARQYVQEAKAKLDGDGQASTSRE